jgi:hypothetical protein
MDQDGHDRHLRGLEEMLIDPSVRSSPEKVADLIADEFLEFGRSGRTYDKTSVIRMLSEEAAFGGSIAPQMRDFMARELAPDVVLLTYRTVGQGPDDGRAIHTLRSSVWKMIGGRWQIIFHQGTLADADLC